MGKKGSDKAKVKAKSAGSKASRGKGDDAGNGNGYADELRELQVELVKMQRHVIAKDLRLLILLEGRDGSGKDGTIKRITEHMSPRDTRIVALGKPSDRERGSWYFQRYVPHLPAAEEIVLFNRSWYNRAGVERVMGFCTDAEYFGFLANVVPFEAMLQGAGLIILKYYLDITRAEQKERLDERRKDPLKQWKLSPIDAQAVKRWDDYTLARDHMLEATATTATPWYVVDANRKKLARLNVIRHILSRLDYEGKDKRLACHDPDIVFPYGAETVERLAR
jgi:polyphosphate kinase 2